MNGDAEMAIELPGSQVSGKIAKTSSWDDFQTVQLGKLKVDKAGVLVLKARPRDAASWKPVNLRKLELTKE
jgi:hypothetical protein